MNAKRDRIIDGEYIQPVVLRRGHKQTTQMMVVTKDVAFEEVIRKEEEEEKKRMAEEVENRKVNAGEVQLLREGKCMALEVFEVWGLQSRIVLYGVKCQMQAT